MFVATRLGRCARSSTNILRRLNATVATPSASTTRPSPAPASSAKANAVAPSSSLTPRPAPSKKELVTPRSKAEAKLNPHGRLSYKAHKILQWKLRHRKHRLAKQVGRLRKKRPNISLSQPRKWNRALAPGAVSAYDEALKFIRADSNAILKQIRQQKKTIKEAEQNLRALKASNAEEDTVKAADAELESLREKLNILEVQGEVNLPDTRWRVRNAMIDMSKPSHRHLFEQRWREEGKLDMLMERLHQMNVVPDIVPTLQPSFDLHVTLRWPHSVLRRKTVSNRFYHPGGFIKPEQTTTPPALYGNVFHTDTRLYTLLMVDPDVPDDNHSFTTFLHWLKPNIPLSAFHREKIRDLNDHTTYIPPHPQQGTPYHRYTILILPQAPKTNYSRNTVAEATESGVCTSKEIDVPVFSEAERKNFDVRAFIKQYGLNPAKGGGAYMFRQVWDETVSKIYTDILKTPEPRYGVEKKPDPYAALKDRKKYV